MNYYFKQIYNFPDPNPLFFLCGVKYNKKRPNDDKRVVLKKFLDKKSYCSIILEENFTIAKYKLIGLENLNDVETLACMIADGIFIIHESNSTAAEIALFASNDSVAKKVFVLVPDRENTGVDNFTGFLSLAYSSIIPRPITFYPVTEKHVISESNIETFTYFNNNRIGENLGRRIDKYLSSIVQNKNLYVIRANYGSHTTKSISYYFVSGNMIHISVDAQLLRYYMIAIFSIPEFRRELRNTKSFFKGLSICEEWFKKTLLNTIEQNEKKSIKNLEAKFEISNSINPRLDLRKAISLILYCFDAFGWIRIPISDDEGITISKESDTSIGFKSVYNNYSRIIGEEQKLDLGGII